MPRPRDGILAMCRNWTGYITEARRTAWGIPQEQLTELVNRFNTAEALLRKDLDADERTRVVAARCRAAFKSLTAYMRSFRSQYCRIPPLSGGDWAALGFRFKAPPASIPVPESQAEADLIFPGIHLVELIRIRPVKGGTAPEARSNYGVRIYYGLSGPPSGAFRFRLTGEPKSGRDLPYSLFTRRKKERVDFDGESGNKVYFCLRYENPRGQAGPFGPILSAVIP
jgi:hypothetical protein